MTDLEKKYKLAIEELGAWSRCPVPAPNCKYFEKCTECWDYFLQSEAERDKDE